jgi:hypothetical protein
MRDSNCVNLELSRRVRMSGLLIQAVRGGEIALTITALLEQAKRESLRVVKLLPGGADKFTNIGACV